MLLKLREFCSVDTKLRNKNVKVEFFRIISNVTTLNTAHAVFFPSLKKEGSEKTI